MSKLPIVITTINGVTPAVRRFAELDGVGIVVVGDRKTPPIRSEGAIEVYTVDRQATDTFRLYEHTPFNHYCRKNLGYLHAIRSGAKRIAETDDDNYPYPGWLDSFSLCEEVPERFVTGPRSANVYKLFTEEHVWPRGLSLKAIGAVPDVVRADTAIRILIWQGLADLDPDVDAIFRLVFGSPEIKFKPSAGPVVLSTGTYCPFNSQNTIWAEEAFPYMYLPMFVRFRFTDILRGYIAQRGIWAMRGHLAFGTASVYQERNAHDLLADFEDELDCYLQVHRLLAILDDCQLSGEPTNDLPLMYEALRELEIVNDQELRAVEAWLTDLEEIREGRR
jgi:hypothetical protein